MELCFPTSQDVTLRYMPVGAWMIDTPWMHLVNIPGKIIRDLRAVKSARPTYISHVLLITDESNVQINGIVSASHGVLSSRGIYCVVVLSLRHSRHTIRKYSRIVEAGAAPEANS